MNDKKVMQDKLGTFLGVFTPTILTILGVIMYLRFGWLLGHMGLIQILAIVVLANFITMITTLSFSAIATNSRVGVGGAYFMISRSLGIEIGGAIGVPLFLSQAVSVTLYSYGLAESLRFVWPDVPIQMATFIIILSVGIIAVPGAGYALKVQIPLMVLVGISIVALAVGSILRYSGGSLMSIQPTGEIGFWIAFAIFFPAVTGIMAGLGLSGDLRDPGQSIPRGSILATLVGFSVYLIIPLLLIMGASAQELREESLIWTVIAPAGAWLVLPGLWAAIFSSAVGSVLGAPRTLQALSKDGLGPRLFSRQTGTWRDLMPGMILTMLLAVAAVLLGDLNAVATVITMFFLTVYGTVNLVAAFESLSGETSWRPRIRIAWPISLFGGLACIAVMFLINPVAGVVAILAELGLWLLLSRRERRAKWADARRGIYESLIRWALVHLAHHPMSARNWRPHILIYVSDAIKELDLIRFGNWFSQGRGVVTVCELVVGSLMTECPDLQRKRTEMQDVLQEEGLVVFSEVDCVLDLVQGIIDVTQSNGLAGLASNTVLLGWPSEKPLQASFLRVMRELEFLNKSLIIGRIKPRHLYPRDAVKRSIHVWWGGLQNNGDLMLLLAYLITRNSFWRTATVKVMSIASDEESRKQTESYLNRLIPAIRIDAEPHVTIMPPNSNVSEVIQYESKDAEVVFLGLATPPEGDEAKYAERLDNLAGDLSTVFFVKNASLFIGKLLETEELQ